MRESTKVGCNAIVIIACLALMAIGMVAQYTKEGVVTATIHSLTTQQEVSGSDGSFTTSYKYLVGTDKGTMQIKPDGIMSSAAFGQLKEGKTYRLHTRGYSFPLIGMYPYIVDAKEE